MSSPYYKNKEKLAIFLAGVIYKSEEMKLNFEDKKQTQELYENYKVYMNGPIIPKAQQEGEENEGIV